MLYINPRVVLLSIGHEENRACKMEWILKLVCQNVFENVIGKRRSFLMTQFAKLSSLTYSTHSNDKYSLRYIKIRNYLTLLPNRHLQVTGRRWIPKRLFIYNGHCRAIGKVFIWQLIGANVSTAVTMSGTLILWCTTIMFETQIIISGGNAISSLLQSQFTDRYWIPWQEIKSFPCIKCHGSFKAVKTHISSPI